MLLLRAKGGSRGQCVEVRRWSRAAMGDDDWGKAMGRKAACGRLRC